VKLGSEGIDYQNKKNKVIISLQAQIKALVEFYEKVGR